MKVIPNSISDYLEYFLLGSTHQGWGPQDFMCFYIPSYLQKNSKLSLLSLLTPLLNETSDLLKWIFFSRCILVLVKNLNYFQAFTLLGSSKEKAIISKGKMSNDRASLAHFSFVERIFSSRSEIGPERALSKRTNHHLNTPMKIYINFKHICSFNQEQTIIECSHLSISGFLEMPRGIDNIRSFKMTSRKSDIGVVLSFQGLCYQQMRILHKPPSLFS